MKKVIVKIAIKFIIWKNVIFVHENSRKLVELLKFY